MRTLSICCRHAFVVFLFSCAIASSAITLTTDTFIGVTDLSFEGQDIAVTNCTLTVDGAHGFNDLQILNGGVLTHSTFTNGPKQNAFSVLNEPHILSAVNSASLNNTNVDTNSIVVTDISGSTVYALNVDYQVTLSNQFTLLTISAGSTIAEGSTVQASYNWAQTYQGFALVVSNDFQIAAGGAINLSGKGYAAGNGLNGGAGTSQATNFPIAFTAGAGGGHAGSGGMSSTFALGGAAYDSTTNPASLGSGGGSGSSDGGSGGGVAQLFIGGTLQLDGKIVADGLPGTNSHSGGGAGGGILLSAQTVAGTGTISAQGGSGEGVDGGGGGGGAMAIFFRTNNFNGTTMAYGGTGAISGGAGTIYMQSATAPAGQLLIANGGQRGTNTLFSTTTISNLTIIGGAVALGKNPTFAVSNLYVGSNSWLSSTDSQALTLTITGDAIVESNAVINADYKSSSGSGAGSASCGASSGGTYGGIGGASVCGVSNNFVYGFVNQPSNLGSPSSGTPLSPGGGAINLNVAGTLFLAGKISANGANSPSATGGGGSGGSVWLTAGTLAGIGTVSANGGAANNSSGGGGGGGRVAVYYSTNSFTGNITACGNTGTNSGGPGTIYLKASTNAIGQVIIDNGGLSGFVTLSGGFSTTDFTISGGAKLTFGTSISLRNLLINTNGWVVPSGTLILSNLIILPGGRLSSDALGTGFPSQSLNGTSGGGGGGGYGGTSASNALGGDITGSIISPSGGGRGNNVPGAGPFGAPGGGFVGVIASGKVQVDGQISANGLTSSALNCGGGGGGGILISTLTLAGTGTISANGGAGNILGGGGGGGGRVAITYVTNVFSGSVMTLGGGGAHNGGAGTIYWAHKNLGGSLLSQQVIVDNNGTIAGTNTLLSGVSGIFDLTVAGGAALISGITTPLTNGNLFIGSNSMFLDNSSSQQFLTVLSNATIEAGAVLSDDAVIAGSSQQGGTLNLTGGGGGSVGMGGGSISNAAGGNASFNTVLGSRGGGASGLGSPGGQGGGGLSITVNGTLQLDGRISTAGGPGLGVGSGGGSGGSISLNPGTISGTGIISANGGPAPDLIGGGGGGGQIAVFYNTNTFTGTLTALGGAGGNYGGAGAIRTKSNISGYQQVVMDNGGHPGSLSAYRALSTIVDLTITGGAVVSNLYEVDRISLIGNLFLGSNSVFGLDTPGTFNTKVRTNAIIQAGALIYWGETTSLGNIAQGKVFRSTGGGGGHGGYGGASATNAAGGNVTADSITLPIMSGGDGGVGSAGSAGTGGGFVFLEVDGVLQMDGKISAEGSTGSSTNSGGGAGGSILLLAGTISGTGTISANGAAANNLGGGGGGGRIAIWANTNLFAGNITAAGGAGANYGGAGTIYLNSSINLQGNAAAKLIVDNKGFNATNTPVFGAVNGVDVLVTNGGAMSLGTNSIVWNNLTISSNSSFGLASNGTSLTLTINSNLTIQPGGVILLDGQGSPAGGGLGAGRGASDSGGGGGHGGVGSIGTKTNFPGGLAYDSITAPIIVGSGGGPFLSTTSSLGGGALKLLINGTLNIGGSISANGTAGLAPGTGGGAGGSLWLTAGTISGSGKIQADGAAAFPSIGGGGGGGRIAVYFDTNLFTGTFSAHGGAGATLSGGAGTIYLKTNSATVGQLIIDNGGRSGTNTPLDSLAIAAAVSLQGAAIANSSNTLTVQSLSVGPGSRLYANPLNPLKLTVLGDALVATNGSIMADAAGYQPGSGPGAGSVDSSTNGSGGGYGGGGGASLLGAAGGGTYGSSNQPVNFGSPGGMSPALTAFSQGGGAIRLVVDGTLTLNGNISASGNDGTIPGSGGGSGGSIWINALNLSGSGSLAAHGGTGESSNGGGGGGGRIAVYANTNLFLGNMFATGGAGASAGQDGTIFVATNLLLSGSVTDTNGTAVGGISLQASGINPTTSDNNGFYSFAVPPIWTGTITPAGSAVIVPSIRTYANLSSNAPNQNFLVLPPSAFNFGGSLFDGTNVNLNWYGINGATYQPYYSSNLVDWVPYGASFMGSNAPIALPLPPTNAPQLFFRLGVSY